MNIYKICWIKDRNNKSLLIPAILMAIITVGAWWYKSIFSMKLILLNINILIPLIIGIILKSTFGFEEDNANYEFIKLGNRKKWINELIINNVALFSMLFFPLIIIYILNYNNITLVIETILVGIFWILLLSIVNIIYNSNIQIIVGCLMVPVLAFFGITNNLGEIWKIIPFLYVFHIDNQSYIYLLMLVIANFVLFLINKKIICFIDK